MVAAAAAVVCGSTLAIAGAASAGPGSAAPDAERFSGANRFGTAAAVSQDLNYDDIVIVNGQAFPDGLAAAVYGDTILLTNSDALPAETIAELERIDDDFGIDNITIVGGMSAVSSDVYEELADIAGFDPVRVAGANRYATALEVAEDYGSCGEVILATGENFPDALAAGPMAADFCAPILLNNGTTVRPDVAEYLLDEGISKVWIVGGESVIPASVETQIVTSLGITTERLAGSNRAATAVAIADELGWDQGVVAVNGNDFPDALSAGPLAYDYNYPIMLVNDASIPAPTAAFHIANCTQIAEIFAVGGTAVISNAVVTGAVAAATCAAPAINSATLVKNDFKQTVFTPNAGLTVTANAGSPADGAAANAWQFAYIQNGTPGTEGVAINTTDYAQPTFVMTANFNNLTNQGFVNVWNASPAAGLTTAATTAPAGLIGGGGGALPLGNTYNFITTPGSQDSIVTVTFDRLVTAATTSGLWRNLNVASGPASPGALTTSAIPATGTTTVTYTWDDGTDPTSIPALPNYQIRFNPGTVQDAASTFFNVVTAQATLTAP
jgi:putative cell wall-binding protein